jgi:hypothetical protein
LQVGLSVIELFDIDRYLFLLFARNEGLKDEDEVVEGLQICCLDDSLVVVAAFVKELEGPVFLKARTVL